MNNLKELARLLKRIDKTTGRVARRNARNALRRELARLWKEADIEFPPIRKDGTEIVRVKKKGVVCPVCKAPMKSFRVLAEHAVKRHGLMANRSNSYGRTRCWCGESRAGRNQITWLARHLAGVGREKLETHAVIGSLGAKNHE